MDEDNTKGWMNKMEESFQLKRKDMDETIYNTTHTWLRRNYGQPKYCERCGIAGSKGKGRWNIEYALKPNRKYSRNRKDYLMLCVSCHEKQDKGCPLSCTIEGCNDEYDSIGFCSKHYAAYRMTIKIQKGECRFCTNPLYTKTLCLDHINKKKAYRAKLKYGR